MDNYNVKGDRKKKSDKAKEKFDRNGGFSSKHVRLSEALLEARNGKNTESKVKSGSKKN
jgi:hypothetical protein